MHGATSSPRTMLASCRQTQMWGENASTLLDRSRMRSVSSSSRARLTLRRMLRWRQRRRASVFADMCINLESLATSRRRERNERGSSSTCFQLIKKESSTTQVPSCYVRDLPLIYDPDRIPIPLLHISTRQQKHQ